MKRGEEKRRQEKRRSTPLHMRTRTYHTSIPLDIAIAFCEKRNDTIDIHSLKAICVSMAVPRLISIL